MYIHTYVCIVWSWNRLNIDISSVLPFWWAFVPSKSSISFKLSDHFPCHTWLGSNPLINCCYYPICSWAFFTSGLIPRLVYIYIYTLYIIWYFKILIQLLCTLVIFDIAMTSMAHIVQWFTDDFHGDFPVRRLAQLPDEDHDILSVKRIWKVRPNAQEFVPWPKPGFEEKCPWNWFKRSIS